MVPSVKTESKTDHKAFLTSSSLSSSRSSTSTFDTHSSSTSRTRKTDEKATVVAAGLRVDRPVTYAACRARIKAKFAAISTAYTNDSQLYANRAKLSHLCWTTYATHRFSKRARSLRASQQRVHASRKAGWSMFLRGRIKASNGTPPEGMSAASTQNLIGARSPAPRTWCSLSLNEQLVRSP